MTIRATADVVERMLLDGHDGRSGARLERVVLRDGTRLVIKTADLASDLGAAVTGDSTGRELELWRRGSLDALPAGIAHCIVDASRDEGGCVVTVMRDLGTTVIGWDHRLTAADCNRIIDAVARMHRHFAGRVPGALCSLERYLTALCPTSLAPLTTGSNPLPAIAVHGWEVAADLTPDDVWAATERVFADPRPLAAALRMGGTTFVHGDLWPVNVAIESGQVVLLDWGLAVEAPGSVDLAAFIAGAAGIATVTREAMVGSYVAAAGCDPAETRLALVVGFLQYAWNKALDAVEHEDPRVRARERADFNWWVGRARDAFDLLG